MDEITEKPTAVLLPNSEQFYMKSEREDYLIQISWPLGWQNGHHPDGVPVPIMSVLTQPLRKDFADKLAQLHRRWKCAISDSDPGSLASSSRVSIWRRRHYRRYRIPPEREVVRFTTTQFRFDPTNYDSNLWIWRG
jgi:hypothetical protein